MCYGLAKLTGVLTHGSVEEGHIVPGVTQGALLLAAPGGEVPTSKGEAEKAALAQPTDPGRVVIEGREYVATPDDPNEEPDDGDKKKETSSTALVLCAVGIGAIVLWSTY